MSMHARIMLEDGRVEQRRRPRRDMRLEVFADVARTASGVVRNLSETGVLLESSTALATEQLVTIALPVAGDVQARVVWTREPFYGLEFVQPVSRAAVSAALLKSPVHDPVELTTPAEPLWTSIDEAADEPSAHPDRGLAIVALATLGLALCLVLIAVATARLA